MSPCSSVCGHLQAQGVCVHQPCQSVACVTAVQVPAFAAHFELLRVDTRELFIP